MKLSELFDPGLLQQMLVEGFVRRQIHPSLPLAIYNYTEIAAFDRVWNPVTEACRGLIVSTATDEIMARPFAKFFNYGETGSPVIPLEAAVEVTDKLDGSLGILYPTGYGSYAIATRGSFISEQAQHATKVWQTHYASKFIPSPGMTYLFEIVYPSNRIVCDYGDTDDLFLLGAVNINIGCSFGPEGVSVFGHWPGPCVQVFSYSTLAEVLAAPPRPGAEGLVVRRYFSNDRIKIKQEDYVALHRIVTGCTSRRVWECLAVWACHDAAPEGQEIPFLVRRLMLGPDRVAQILAMGVDWLARYQEGTPEEFRDWVDERVCEMRLTVTNRREQVQREFTEAMTQLGLSTGSKLSREDRKRFASAVASSSNRHQLFALLQGQEIDSSLWREIRPEHELPYRAVDESVA